KIFLTASPEERAKRRYDELISKGVSADYEAVLADLKTRDYNDSHREIAPLKEADDAITIDTTGYELNESVELIFQTVKDLL
ncbi:MAG: cytidylate kinase, partial [Ruminococcaceae bacterium]|nr:cytidylate kinase [Oscillospiraceae bacterium]